MSREQDIDQGIDWDLEDTELIWDDPSMYEEPNLEDDHEPNEN